MDFLPAGASPPGALRTQLRPAPLAWYMAASARASTLAGVSPARAAATPIEMVRRTGAREVHMRVTAPPWKHPCYYGIDTPSEGELIASNMSVEEIGEEIGCDSIGFISVDGLRAISPKTIGYCTACFTGEYDAGKPTAFTKDMMEFHAPAPTR